jgi:hypothetical protein
LGLNDSQAASEFDYERPFAARREYKGCGKSVNGFMNKGDGSRSASAFFITSGDLPLRTTREW